MDRKDDMDLESLKNMLSDVPDTDEFDLDSIIAEVSGQAPAKAAEPKITAEPEKPVEPQPAPTAETKAEEPKTAPRNKKDKTAKKAAETAAAAEHESVEEAREARIAAREQKMEERERRTAQKIAERQGEVAPEQIMEEFQKNYLDRKEPYHFKKCKITDFESAGDFTTVAVVTYTDHGVEKQFEGVGNGPIDAVQRGLEEELGINIKVLDYSEHALTSGSGAQAASYIHMMDQDRKRVTYGVGISSNITRASLRGIFSAVNRLYGDN